MPLADAKCSSNNLLHLQPVTVLEDISDQTTAENQSTTFQCQIRINYPEITLTWYKGTQKLENSEKYNISSVGDRHCLHINNCQTKDQGNYRVVCGPHISNAKLAVSGKTSCPTWLQHVHAFFRLTRGSDSELTHIALTSFNLLCSVDFCFLFCVSL